MDAPAFQVYQSKANQAMMVDTVPQAQWAYQASLAFKAHPARSDLTVTLFMGLLDQLAAQEDLA